MCVRVRQVSICSENPVLKGRTGIHTLLSFPLLLFTLLCRINVAFKSISVTFITISVAEIVSKGALFKAVLKTA